MEQLRVFVKATDVLKAAKELESGKISPGGYVFNGEKVHDPKVTSAPLKLAWKPNNLPWRANRRGTDSKIWYSVEDSIGNEIFFTDRSPIEDEDTVLNEVYLVLTAVNGSRTVTVDGKEVRIEWR